MTDDAGLLEETAEELFEHAPCGYLATRLDGTILKVNQTFETWTGRARHELSGTRFQDLLSPGARIYHETHYSPLLQMQGSVSQIALDVVRADGSRLPALVNSVLVTDDAGRPRIIRTTVFDATDRRRYEQELLKSRRREQEIAQHLQRSLLSGELPHAEGLDIAVAYRPAVRGTEVGGDWYDAFWLESEDCVGFVVGDVVGRGIEAAATMGQLRSACRALASTGIGPGAVLDGLDRYARRHGVGQMATVAYAQLHLATRRLTYTCAGHPPPLLHRLGEEPTLLWEGRSVPLDAHAVQTPRAEAAITLDPESLVLLYTDGLVERRHESLSAGFERLQGAVGAAADRTPAALSAALLRAFHDPAHPDDVCLLALTLA